KKGQTFDVHCYARRLGSPLDSLMSIYLPRHETVVPGDAVIQNDDAVGPDSYFRWTVPHDGDYILAIRDHLGKGGPDSFYRVEFTEPAYASVLGIPKVAVYSQERQTIPVPRGNRYATVINLARTGWGGDAVLGAVRLPPGLTMHCETMPGN